MKQVLPKIDEKAFLEAAIQHHAAGNLTQAKELYRVILTQNPKNAEAIFRLGTMALQVEQYEKAVEFIEKAIKIGPRSAPMYINLGAAHRNLGDFNKAIRIYEKALKLGTHLTDIWFNKGRALQGAGRFEDARKSYETALTYGENDADIWINLGVVLRRIEDADSALQCFEKAARLNPSLGASYSNAAAVLFDKGYIEIAMVLIDKAIEVEPENHKYRYELSNFLLTTGDLERGWQEFESRYDYFSEAKAFRRPTPPEYWDGTDLPNGKVLLWTEQGLGEEILTSTIIPDMIEAGIDFVFECSDRLKAIMQRSFGDDRVISWNQHKDAVEAAEPPFQYQYPALSLVKKFRPDLDHVIGIKAALKDDQQLTNQLRTKYKSLADGKRIIGISWRSKNEEFGEAKTLPIESWLPILEFSGIFFVNIQYGDCKKELSDLKKRHGIDVYIDEDIDAMGELDPAFSQLGAMDLVLSVSNSNVHMAGSLGVPTWSLLPKARGLLWFWFMDRPDSPWYPSVRLFRQKTVPSEGHDSWPDVIQDVKAALQEWLSAPLPPRDTP